MFLRIEKQKNTFDNKKLFSIFYYGEQKQNIFREHLLVVFYCFHLFSKCCFFKKIIQAYTMIKNKIFDIKNIFKTYLKILKKKFKTF